jgi:L-ascorbate metabolism protein UlaG (beta-lactamase superfamily)
MKRLKKRLLNTGIIFTMMIILFSLTVYIYMLQPQFGSLPKGKRLELIKKSEHYIDGRFRNIIEKPTISPGYDQWNELWKTIAEDHPRREPATALPSIKTNLKTISKEADIIIWFGHSSFFLQLDGVKILVDPVFSDSASPLPNSVRAYKGTNIYTAGDMPDIDYMLLSHDHYDHLDYETAKALQPKVKKVICGLGAGAHYEHWGYSEKQLIETDWANETLINKSFSIYSESTHHESGRTFKSGQSQWLSFVIKSNDMTIYYSGDGGYTDRFKYIARKFPNINWAIVECGQYDKAWQSVHLLPNEVAQATLDLKAENLLPVHHSKFTLANHPWDEPLKEITKLSKDKDYHLATPKIGEVIRLKDKQQVFEQWWLKL